MAPQREAKGGFSYFVTGDQLRAFQSLSPLQRLKWVDEVRRFTLLARTPETEQRQERLRQGKTIVERPLKNVQFCSRTRKAKISTTVIY